MNPSGLGEVWVYLSASPLGGLTLTLLAYQGAYEIYRRFGMSPLANPVALAVAAIVALLTVAGIPYETYFGGAQFVHFLLGPATVALAVPLYAQLPRLKTMLGPAAVALLAGSLVAVVSAVGIGWLFGASEVTLKSLAPKSATTPIAMGIADKIGGLPSLTAVLVVTTGILGAVMARGLLDALKVEDPAVRGFAVGVAAHGIGTARAFQVSETAGAFSALAMGLNGLATAVLVPFLAGFLRG